MQYGFVIDNRKCIGCHACTTACKSEHDVPVGVNRTWVKQVEKGVFPNTRRLFSVMRCNHCSDAPCVEICPVEALFIRDDGIVDFDKRRCIGCKSCMQACPYDALYIDPDTHTAAKCNYCAHRVDIGLEPACVNICPEHAIISGDMDNPETEISRLLAREQVKVRKAEKGTRPNLFYIDGDETSLNPTSTEKSDQYLWSSQSRGVGHFAKAAEKLAWSNEDVVRAVMDANGRSSESNEPAPKSIQLMLSGMEKARRAYDAPDKGILWGWEVSGYVLTKAISAGAFLITFLASAFGWAAPDSATIYWSLGLGLFFLLLTGLLLVKDLDRPDRFLYVLLRPQWNSWLVRGGYAITFFGAALTLSLLSQYFQWAAWIGEIINWATAILAVIVAVYTAFLFAQAKGRDFWQSPALSFHMLIHCLMAGAAVMATVGWWTGASAEWMKYLNNLLLISIPVNLGIMFFEFLTPHPTSDSKQVAHSIWKGHYKTRFWIGVVLMGNIFPLVLLSSEDSLFSAVAGVLVLAGIFITERIWVEAPQRLPLS